jgi:hypothetical protein
VPSAVKRCFVPSAVRLCGFGMATLRFATIMTVMKKLIIFTVNYIAMNSIKHLAGA